MSLPDARAHAVRRRNVINALPLPALKLIVTSGVRNAAIDMAAAAARGIPVCGTESLGSPTAELTFGLVSSSPARSA